MIILGITHPISLNCAACILVDGRLIAFAEEERFTRLKHAPHVHPENAVHYCLTQAGVAPHDIDVTAIGFSPPQKGDLNADDIHAYFDNAIDPGKDFQFRTSLDLLQRDTLIKSFGKRLYYDHHLCHAASTLVPSGFQEANFISIDGWGGATSGMIGHWQKDGDIKTAVEIPVEQSWGAMYEYVTYYLGFRPHSGEGKTMGLAAYGSVDTDLLPDFCSGELALPDVQAYQDYLARHFTVRYREEINQRHRNLAATLQFYYERSLKKIACSLSEKTGLKSFALAGGVALNCSGNGALAREHFVDQIFVQPASHDGGSALGAAILAHREYTGTWPEIPFSHPYWGSGFTQDEIKRALDFAKAPYREVDPAREAADALSRNLLVGFFQGRAEIGPRALGNRSILAHPGYSDNLNRVNLQVKRREPWRPLAPSVKTESFMDLFDARVRSPFMLLAFQVKENWKSRIPAVVHVDGSARPQSVSQEANPMYYVLIQEFEKQTEIPAVLNTSFNLDDEPIVNSPDQALATFYRSGLDVLIMGNFAINKNR